MKKILQPLAAMLFALASFAVLAQTPQPPEIAARSYMLVDATANQMLAGRDIDAAVEPASLTKLMTEYLVFDALRAKKITLEQRLPVSVRAWKIGGSTMFIDPKMTVPVDDLIKGMIVQSGNDATIVLAEGVGGTVEHFVDLMNAEARRLGMKNTTYRNPEGLPMPGHTTTARDLSILATHIVQDFPEYLHYHSIKKYRYQRTPSANDTNGNALLFRDPTVDGLKTGHTDAAGYSLIATAKRDFPNLQGRRMMAIVLGANSESTRTNEAQKLLNWGYTAFEDVKLFDGNQPVVTPEVWKGAAKTAKLGRQQPIVLTIPSGTSARIRTQVVRPEPLIAPLAKGQQVGVLRVSSGDQSLMEVPLVALEPVEEAGALRRMWDAVRLWIK
ncbi:MAG TPA: D-alanyl-D-alanine carboxypeptidase family protein [Ramlibacter sp.]|nr:D-alanyl-D-alanine carboxypeptidase family protein [Ramlibacter sp.]